MLYYILSISLVPILIFLSSATSAQILPSLNHHKSWTIEDAPMVLFSIVGIYLAYLGYKKKKNKVLLYIAMSLNILFGIFFSFTMYYLWGEKF